MFQNAVAAHGRGELEAARALYEAALADPAAPRADILNNLATIAFAKGQFPEAERQARSALAADPDSANAFNTLGLALQHQGRDREAIAAFRACVAGERGHHRAWANMAASFSRDGRHVAALAAMERALTLAPELYRNKLATVLYLKLDMLKWDGIDALARQAQAMVRAGQPFNPYVLLFICLDPEAFRAASRNHARHLAKAAAALPAWKAPADANKGRIRVGYFSRTLRDHATGHLVREMLAAHDRARFEIFLYPYADGPRDAFETALLASAEHAVDLAPLDDGAALERIRRDRLDVLIDIDGYGNDGRSIITAARAAPVQVNWLGFLATMGSPAIDYIIADNLTVPDGSRAAFDEQVVRLPGGFMPSDSRRAVSDRFKTRADLGLPEDRVVMAAFNQARKIGPATLDMWAAVLRQAETAVLWVWQINRVSGDGIVAELGRRGVASDRVIRAPSLPTADHLCRLRFADFFLDTFPYNGHTMTHDALFMGLPGVTLAGRTYPSRVAASLLARVGLSALIATTPESYVARAVALARDPEARRQARATLAAEAARTGVFSGVRYVREFEAALARMAARARAGLPPEAFDVPRL